MAINLETAKEYAGKPAVSCCRFELGAVIAPEHLEDPAIFADLEDSGLLTIPGNCLTIGQVLGEKLIKTIPALTPITSEYCKVENTHSEESASSAHSKNAQTENFPALHSPDAVTLHIGDAKDINLTFPVGLMGTLSSAFARPNIKPENPSPVRSLKKRYFKIDNVLFGDETHIDGTTLTLKHTDTLCAEAIGLEDLVVDMKLDVITPDRYTEYSETIMDVQPIACKEHGELGEGITRVLDGIVFVVTGTDENGVQIGEFGSSEGEMSKNIMWNRPGAPDSGDILIKTQVTIKAGANMERPGPLAAHKVSDRITEEIRKALRNADDALCIREENFTQVKRPDKPRVVIVKEVMGQGAMHDNLILPTEPVGVFGARPNVDLGNLPIMLSPTEMLDGAIHALTCIGPASKECSRHYFREPLVLEAMSDEDINLVGVILVGSPQANSEKFYVSKRLGMMVEAMELDGAIVTTEGFGNNHIDFASHIEQIGQREISVVGVTYSAVQGALVTGNKYMKYLIDVNKSEQGIENEILSYNTLCHDDAVRALAMLKTVMAGGDVKAAERKWTADIVKNNTEAIRRGLEKQ